MSLLCACHDAPRNGTVISDQFNIPRGPVLGVHLRQDKVIAQENKPFLCFGIAKADAAQGNGVGFRRLGTGEDDRLVAAQPRGLVDRSITTPTVVHVPFGAGYEERHVASKSMQPGEVDVTRSLT